MAEQEKMVVAYLGPEASYTHQAALDSFPPSSSSNATLTPCTTIADVFTAVQNGTATRGVVPFENSSNGSVVFTLDLIANLHGMHPDIEVCGEAYVAVRHCLLGRAAPNPNPSSSSNPGSATATKEEGVGKDGKREVKIDPTFSPLAIPTTSLSHIRTLYSHPQAWGQCKAFIAAYLKSTSLHDVSSTSRAAELVAQDTSGTSAALSSAAAAKVFGLDVLANGINDRAGNTTRFLVLRNATSPSPSSTPISDATWKSLVTFTLEHTNPGSLAQCLGAFGSQGLNLTSINTRPSGVDNWHYVFYVELQGRKEQGDGGAVNRALGELGRVARSRRWLGSWESKL